MNITGIITEYNPFHKGHLYHLKSAIKTTNSDAIVCVMSGNFVQRGGPAIIDKYKRAEIAILNGVDLVLELPCYYSVSSAEFFAKGSVSILHSIGVVNNIFFGSECGDIEKLKLIANFLTNESEEFKLEIKNNLDSGLTYAKARELSINKFLKEDNLKDILKSSNNILGIEYIKALIRLNSNITPLTLKRQGSNYNDKELSSNFSSATSIREFLKNNKNLDELNNYLPAATINYLKDLKNSNYNFVFEKDMYKYIKYRILSNNINFNNLQEIKEGLDNKILKEIYSSISFEDFILKIKSKRYTYTKISRLLTQIFLSFDSYNYKELLDEKNLYARVLAFNGKGKKILKEMKKNSQIPIITKISKKNINPLLNLDINATKAYSILNNSLNPLSDFLNSPIIKD
ncbi:nucleotidyltransferase [Caproiciproducens sp. MSJ-32]|uniref:nucleotidyltransferase n=1 Tax=Caproiciproducens sp. MSJ-32 TaxID=2841527 RepID=UPI001C0FC628|nr:nucleotidyltransferase [Caproiciproducens sp. MSJ-32]MBU5454034.1 nucleotidyltransferase [Caproiciproducens sp. MSJ-32]